MTGKNKGNRGDKGDTQRTTRKVNPIAEKAKSRMNPPEQTALKPGPKRGLQQTTPVGTSYPRPMPPAPPSALPSPFVRGTGTTMAGPERPKSPYVLELEEKAAHMRDNPAMQRICDKCGDTKMVNVKRNVKNEIIKFEACPKCIDCKEA